MKKIKLVILAGLLFAVASMSAQDINSPYSRYGLGQLYGKNVGTQLQSMGGISIGLADPYSINVANPASYGVFDSLTVVFQTGIAGGLGTLKNTLVSSRYNYGTINQIVLGMPITNWWRTSFGVVPFSKVGYDTQGTTTIAGYGDFTNERWGQGGTAEVYWGNSFNLGKNLRVGFNLNYLFGNKRRYNIVYSPDSTHIFGTKVEDYMSVSGILFDWGVQYDIHLKDNKVLTLGATYRNKTNVSSYRNSLAVTLTGGYGSNVDYVRDTVQYIPREDGTIVIPESFGFGFTFSKKENWLFGADIEWQKWSQYQAFGQSDSLQNSLRIAIGGELTPTHTSISSLIKRMTYRLGMRYNQSYLHLNGYTINEFAVTGGVQFPFKRSRSNVSLGFEIGNRGTLNNNLIKESFFNFTFGINIVEGWFYKRKYR